MKSEEWRDVTVVGFSLYIACLLIIVVVVVVGWFVWSVEFSYLGHPHSTHFDSLARSLARPAAAPREIEWRPYFELKKVK